MTYALSARAAQMYEDTFVPALFADWAQHLVSFAPVHANQSVLDVACGTGIVARAAAGVPARVAGLDLNPAMLAVAARLEPSVTWTVGDAGALPYGDGEFDVVLSQAGLMFFGDQVAALREMGRVARGTVAIQVPGRLAESAGYQALTSVVARYADPSVVDLLASYFSVGEPEGLRQLFAAAGLRIDRFATRQSATRLDSVDTFLAVELLPLAETVPAEVHRQIVDECREALRPFIDRSGAIAAPIEVHLIAAAAS